MAEKQNCSNPKITSATAKRRISSPALTKILKSQTSSYQHRACPNVKPRSSGGFKMFLLKVLIAGSAVYLTSVLGVWREPEESNKIMAKITEAFRNVNDEGLLSNNVKTDLLDKFSKSKKFLTTQLEGIPEEMKACYEKSEKYINDLIKGK